MLTFETDAEAGVIEFTVDGHIDKAEFEAVVKALEAQIERHGTVNVVEVIRDFSGMDPSLWWQDMTWGLTHLSKFARAAVVTDSGWIGPMVRGVSALMPAQIRVFPMRDLEAARAWARGLPTG